jgi:predicted transcriptional regulator
VHEELILKGPLDTVDVAEVVNRGTARVDPCLQRLHDTVAQQRVSLPAGRSGCT